MENETAQSEIIFFKDSITLVSQSRFVSNGKTYAIRNISSVYNFRIKKSRTGAIFLIILGLFLGILGGITSIVGILAAIFGIILIIVTKDDFAVRINSNSGEMNCLVSKDFNYIQKVVNALNEAIIYRG